MAYMHIGKDFTPPDVPGKVTGRIKYAEDYTREGMVYARLLQAQYLMPGSLISTPQKRLQWRVFLGC